MHVADRDNNRLSSVYAVVPCSLPPTSYLCVSCSDSLLCSLIVFGLQTVDIKLWQGGGREEDRELARQAGKRVVNEVVRELAREVTVGQ